MKQLLLTIISIILALLGFSCSSDGVPDEVLTLYPGEKYDIISKNTVFPDAESDYPFVASVEDAVIYANYTGTATIETEGRRIQVDVLPRHRLYVEPCMEWGLSSEEIRLRDGGLCSYEDDMMLYWKTDNPAVSYYIYYFERNHLVACAVAVPVSYESMLEQFMSDCYRFDGNWQDRLLYSRDDEEGNPYLAVSMRYLPWQQAHFDFVEEDQYFITYTAADYHFD